MKKKLISILLIGLMLLCSACGGNSDAEASGALDLGSSEAKARASSAAQEVVPSYIEESSYEATTEAEPETFCWDPVPRSSIYESMFSEDEIYCVSLIIKSILCYETELSYPDTVELWGSIEIVPYYFPVYYYVVSDITYENGQATINYLADKETTENLINDFADKVEWWLNSATLVTDTPLQRAVFMYNFMSQNITYNEAKVDLEPGDPNSDVSPYNAIMYQDGICQSFGPAYAYFLMELGIDAAVCGGLSDDNAAHEWTLFEMNSLLYYADVTFENSDGDGEGLKYFGMNREKRYECGAYSPELINVGECNRLRADKIQVEDTRFSSLWNLQKATEIARDGDFLQIMGVDLDGNNVIISVQ